MKKFLTDYHGLLHGCDYNPEQWLAYPDILKKDVEYMKKANCNVMSIGIFSWSYLEPEEGKYNFEYMDEVIERLTENSIKIILATPSGARPRWLAEKYPEVLRVGKDNVRNLYGLRHNHCYTSPVYRKKAAEIDRKLAERYGKNSNIILWHISNEYGGECHCELCQAAFRKWVQKKYDNDLNKLNHAWWTGFWSHTVTDWEQIHSPSSIGEPDSTLPGLYIDWREFVTHQTAEFMKNEIDAVKEYTPDIPVTTNFMGPYQPLDYNYMKNYVDVISWDSYPEWHSSRGNVIEAYSIAFAHDLHRCFKQQPFLLMESTPSNTNWLHYCKLKRPNMHKLSSIQAIAHGSDSVQYFQWRKGRGGSEKFHGAVIDHNGKAEGCVFNDVRELGAALGKINDIAGTNVNAEAAVVYDFKNRWAIESAQGFNNYDKKYKRTCINHYKEFWKRGINTDVIDLQHDLSKYKILVLPMLYSMSEEEIEKVEQFAANGGTVIATYITGYVNRNDLCYLGGFPGGKLKDVFGITADETDTLYESDRNSVRMNGKSYEVIDYCELITPHTAQVLGSYEHDFYKDTPAVLKNEYKSGKAFYIACRDTGELLNDFYEQIIKDAGIDAYSLPEGVTVHTRGDYTFVENYTVQEQSVEMKKAYTDIETDITESNIRLEPFGIKILK